MPNAMPDVERSLALLSAAEELARAATPAAAYFAVTSHLPPLVGAAAAIVFERRQQTREHYLFIPAGAAGQETARTFAAVWPMTTGGLVSRDDVAPGTAYEPLFEACGSPAALAHAPVGTEAVLVVTFAAGADLPTDADWHFVQGLATQAAAAVERISAVQRLHELTLEDPDTGLGNRRLVELVLQQGFAQASRGEPLSVVGIRPRSTEATPSRSEAPAQPAEQRLAELLRVHARGADTLARFGDDGGVFVVVLRASSAAGAEAFLRRVLEGAGEAALSCVVTEYDERFETPGALLDDVVHRVQLAQAG
jgi:GAF domain-containing protein